CCYCGTSNDSRYHLSLCSRGGCPHRKCHACPTTMNYEHTQYQTGPSTGQQGSYHQGAHQSSYYQGGQQQQQQQSGYSQGAQQSSYYQVPQHSGHHQGGQQSAYYPDPQQSDEQAYDQSGPSSGVQYGPHPLNRRTYTVWSCCECEHEHENNVLMYPKRCSAEHCNHKRCDACYRLNYSWGRHGYTVEPVGLTAEEMDEFDEMARLQELPRRRPRGHHRRPPHGQQ
ncbi:hypothetical protein F5B17DRAFT_448337, partial [Nemania serpens]